MFGLGTMEIGIILLVALVVLGPQKLPELARSLGKGLRELRRASNDFRSNMEQEFGDLSGGPQTPARTMPPRPPSRPGVTATAANAKPSPGVTGPEEKPAAADPAPQAPDTKVDPA